ncbi:DNA cytosine methyltransferase [Streptomyces hygroscopicus]|uniref:DNA cytosine methyltransferase n=1 Tax=Streptomyces hygroscopicus TaxID=1912 RepID=UPI0037FA4FFF
MNGPRIASLCSGYGGLEEAAKSVYGGEVVFHADPDPGASKILNHHWPHIPNLGDITAIDWRQVLDEHGDIDIATMGFPCQDVSLAGPQAGLAPGTRSGLWSHCAQAISVLQPRLVVIENVRGLLSAPAHSDLEPCPWCMGGRDDEPVLRALGAVLGDLANLGFDAEWVGLPASDPRVRAPHERWREFVLAWPTTEDPYRPAGGEWRPAAPGQTQGRGARADAGRRGGVPAATEGVRLLPTPAARDWKSGASNIMERNSRPLNEFVVNYLPRRGDWVATNGVDYGPAIRRWEAVTGRPAPEPTEPGDRGNRRLSPAFPEWMHGLPEGHVTGVPGLDRNDQLRAIGNGVVPLQAEAGIRIAHARAFPAAELAPAA